MRVGTNFETFVNQGDHFISVTFTPLRAFAETPGKLQPSREIMLNRMQAQLQNLLLVILYRFCSLCRW